MGLDAGTVGRVLKGKVPFDITVDVSGLPAEADRKDAKVSPEILERIQILYAEGKKLREIHDLTGVSVPYLSVLLRKTSLS